MNPDDLPHAPTKRRISSPNDKRFTPAELHNRSEPVLCYFDLWEDDSSLFRTRDGIVPLDDIEKYLNFASEYGSLECGKDDLDKRSKLRVLSCHFNFSRYTIGCGEQIFNHISESFNLHKDSKSAILNNCGAFGRYFTGGNGSQDFDTFCLVLKVINCINIGYDSLSLTFDRRSGNTRAFIHGLPLDDFHRLVSTLRRHQDAATFRHPLLLAFEIFQHHRWKTEQYRAEIDDSVVTAEFLVGIGIPGILEETKARHTEMTPMPGRANFETLVRRLHSCQTELITMTCVGRFGKEMGMFLQKTAGELQTYGFLPAEKGILAKHQELVHDIEFASNLFITLVSQASSLKERVQSQVNLTFSLIAQDENRISRSMAEESTIIAVETKRDSAAMKTIALLTIVFLPPTFVATFFSMTMFDWTPAAGRGVTSKYIWVYWAVAVPLTIVVLVTWRVWWKLEDKKYVDDLQTARKDKKHGLFSLLPDKEPI